MQNELLTPSQVAEELKLSSQTIWAYIRNGKLKAIKINNRNYRIKRSEIQRFLKECRH